MSGKKLAFLGVVLVIVGVLCSSAQAGGIRIGIGIGLPVYHPYPYLLCLPIPLRISLSGLPTVSVYYGYPYRTYVVPAPVYVQPAPAYPAPRRIRSPPPTYPQPATPTYAQPAGTGQGTATYARPAQGSAPPPPPPQPMPQPSATGQPVVAAIGESARVDSNADSAAGTAIRSESRAAGNVPDSEPAGIGDR